MAINRAPFNLLVDDDGSNSVGSVFGKADIKDVLLDPIDALPGVSGLWTAYAPSWAGPDGFGPVLNNGTLSGRYLQLGKWIDVAIVLQMGTTTSFGTSTYWTLTLPFTPKVVGATGAPQEVSFRAGAVSGAGSVLAPMVGYSLGPSVYIVTVAGGLVNPTTPFTWASGSVLSVRGSYELP